MKKRCLFICVFLFICVQLNVECQVCTRSVKKFVPVRKTFYRTYVATYKKANCWFRCTRTMIKSYIEHRDIIDSRRETVKYCCSGYIRNDTVSDKDIKCIPKCSTKCENGYCKEPGKCEYPNSISSTSNDNNRTELFDIIIENSTLYTSYVTIPGNIDVKFNITKEAIHKTSSLTLWMLIAIALTILNSMLIIIILFIKRKALYKYCKGDSYAVKAEVSTTEVSEQFDFNQIKFSSIMRKKQNEEREQEECNNKA
ncbi:uncharacterized protein LOC113522932 isoform X2 [Galleria mellonella]|uniref:Uncharacterized protein LOC113522932 isoform X2 n=1 Tax=Galleria mellonella TaxID=7137 RepID=A0A6J3C8D8_GALME|nr:uncharacterized protein LOC113522932 isoform X2 [Galleria mellonella]